MKRSLTLAGALVLAFGSMLTSAAQAGGSYFNLGAGVTASGSSADGSVVGAYVSGGSFYMWTAASGLTSIGGNWEGGVASVSDNGALISGSAIGSDGLTQAATYNVAAGTWTPLGGLGSASGTSSSSAWGISGDGRTVVGLGWINAGSAHAVQSTAAGTLVDLGSAGGSSRANDVSANGSIVVGWAELSDGYWQGAMWRDGSLTLLTDAKGGVMPTANAISGDGHWIVGQGGFDMQTWRYNTSSGEVEYLGDYNVAATVQSATGISADGRVIVGYDRNFSGPPTLGAGTIWIEGLGMQNLTSYVSDHGVDLNGRRLALPLGVSADGNTFYGLDNTGSGFVVSLTPVPEPATALTLSLGLIGMAAAARRRKARVQ